MKNMCVSAGISILFDQVRYEHPHQKKARKSVLFSMKFVPSERVKYLRYEIFTAQMLNMPAAYEETNFIMSETNNKVLTKSGSYFTFCYMTKYFMYCV